MISLLKPYPVYKNVPMDLLDRVPDHWEVPRLRAHLSRNDSGIWGDEFSDQGTAVLRSTEQTVDGRWQISHPARRLLSEEERKATLLREGDLVITKSSGSPLHIGKTSVVTAEMEKTGFGFSNFMQRLRLNSNLMPHFVWFVLNSPVGRQQMENGSTTTTGLGNLSATTLANLRVVVPPLCEQRIIVRFLNYMDRRIRRYIRAKQKLIALLNEQKQTIIHQVVTRGLDPNVRLKPSGVEWLGDVPEHWGVAPLRWSVSVRSGEFIPSDRVQPEPDDSVSYPVVGGNGPIGYTSAFTHKAGTIAVGRVGALCGNIHLMDQEAWITDNALAVTVITGFSADYLAIQLRDMNLNRLSKANAQPLITGEILKGQYAARPPMKEQELLVGYLTEIERHWTTLVSDLERELMLLREYRTRLISDVVTGKLDVREAAANLPDEPEDGEDLEPLNDMDGSLETDSDDEVSDSDTEPEEVKA